MIQAFRLVVGPGDVERHAMLVNGETRKLRIHDAARVVKSFLERPAFADAVGDGRVERGEKIFGQGDAVGDVLWRFQRRAPAPALGRKARQAGPRSTANR